MFKSNKKSYQMKDDADEISVAVPTKKKHHHHQVPQPKHTGKQIWSKM